MNITPIFPTPIAYFFDFISSKERLDIWERIKNTPHYDHDEIQGNGFSTHSHNPHLLDKKIKDRIQSTLDEYNKTCGNYPSKISDIWSNIQNKGSVLTEHSHPNSMISGALYINVDAESTLHFHNPNQYIYYTLKKEQTPYNFEHQWMPVKNCELVLFPSWLRHGNNKVINKMNERIVISFNSRMLDNTQ